MTAYHPPRAEAATSFQGSRPQAFRPQALLPQGGSCLPDAMPDSAEPDSAGLGAAELGGAELGLCPREVAWITAAILLTTLAVLAGII
ncbi:MAG: hypothetical protein KGJ41_03540 [Rhodospirillales bacterium]|nr:hypothetical protein [Rhodospirillales bacterium]MDE2198073.1 hypothetical protein [Rhodospirillales bacterium]MDE2573924.1 hypothetical protein [Rhodospirillales bacterium]